MATTPPPTSTTTEAPPVQVKEDPDSLALRGRLVAAEDKQAAAAAAMATAGQAMADLLKPAPVTDAELWRGFLHTAAQGVMRHPRFGDPMADAALVADKMLAEYRKRYP
jgi:hypothetical protein